MPDYGAGFERDISRRQMLMASAALVAGSLVDLTACSPGPVEGRRIREVTLRAAPSTVDLGGGRSAEAFGYNGSMPGSEIRVTEGQKIRVRLINGLDAPTSVHWHGVPQRGTNRMDGVPGVTQSAVVPGGEFTYEFTAEPAGTFFFHSHYGLQLEHGLYAPLIIEPKQEPLSYDREYVLVLDDWPVRSPEAMLARLLSGEAMGEMSNMMRAPISGTIPISASDIESAAARTAPDSFAGLASPQRSGVPALQAPETQPDVAYESFLINGREQKAPHSFELKRGERVRLRLINAGASTGFRFAVGGHRMMVTHADGFPVNPVEVDTLEISVGERYDVIVSGSNPGVWPIVAMSVDEPSRGARALFHYLDVRTPPSLAHLPAPRELSGRLLAYSDLTALDDARWSKQPDRLIDAPLRGQMMPYEWTIGGRSSLSRAAPAYAVKKGEVVRVRMRNSSPMRHPMHLHGHSFKVLTGAGGRVAWKDTITVNPGATIDFEFLADNPGDWLFHCHHSYHQEAGMMRVVRYADR